MPLNFDVRTQLSADALKATFSQALTDVDVQSLDEPVSVSEQAYITSFINAEQAVEAVCISELNIAAYLSAALRQQNKEDAEQSIEASELEQPSLEQLNALMQTIESLLKVNEKGETRCRETLQASQLPEDVYRLIKSTEQVSAKQFNIKLSQYGSGCLTIIAKTH